MPKRKYGLGGPLKRNNALKKKRKATAIVSVPRSIGVGKNIISNRKRVTLRFATRKSLNVTVAQDGAAYYAFRANSLYDPDYTTGALQGQPRGFDQMAALYETYRVERATIEARFVASDSESFIPFIQLRNSPTDVPNLVDVLEAPDTVVSKYSTSNRNNGHNTQYLTMSVDPIRWMGYKSRDNLGCEAETGANPSELCYFYVGMIKPSSPTAAMTGDIVVTISYEATFMQPKLPGAS